MAISKSYSPLAQLSPVAGVLTDFYEVPIGSQTIESSIFICNRNSFPILFSLALALESAVDSDAQYLYSLQKLGPNLTFVFTTGCTLTGNDPNPDLIRIFTNYNKVSFNMFGVEIATL